MGRPKKFEDPDNVTFTLERAEHDDLRLIAARHRKSVSEFLHDLVIGALRRKPPARTNQTDSES